MPGSREEGFFLKIEIMHFHKIAKFGMDLEFRFYKLKGVLKVGDRVEK